ncbi:MAG: NAD(+) synthase [Acidobacteriia bacterium]|nr:NAD(+) synthase [Terriglobia bacterium]
MSTGTPLSASMLTIDAAQEAARIETAIRDQILNRLRRKGAVLGISGGIDSSVVAALCVRALGRERVLGLFLPELDSSDDSLRYGELLARRLRIDTRLEDISPILTAAGCYRRRDDAIRSLVPEYGANWKCKLVMPDATTGARYAISSLVVQSPEGNQKKVRLTAQAYSDIVAATNFKQRARKMLEYYHADRINYAVAGTPNRLEYDQGFFVKNGDGAADLKPIAHLYKTQVYQLAAYLQIPQEIQQRPSTTDTFSLPQSQEEFYFSLPLDKFDLCLFGKNAGLSVATVATAAGLTTQQVDRVFAAIDSKRTATRYLHFKPLLVEAVPEVDAQDAN